MKPLTGKVTLKCKLQYANGDGANNGYLAFRRQYEGSSIGEVRTSPENENSGDHPGPTRCHEQRRDNTVSNELQSRVRVDRDRRTLPPAV